MQAWRERLRTVQWERGLRGAIAVGSAMVVCHALGRSPGAAALGGFDALLVDNGGPYRTRLATMATTLLGGAAAFVIGCLVPHELGLAVVATLAVCFAVIFARVVSQPVASSAVLVLILYFAGVGGTVHTLAGALGAAGMILAGGAWAVVLSLVLWPVDPFRPARTAVAECYGSLGRFPFVSLPVESNLGQPDAIFEWRRLHRAQVEAANAALAATSARAPARTIRARNLTVLLETADLLLARTIRMAELAELAGTQDAEARARLEAMAQWLHGGARAIEAALRQRPADAAAAFGRDGSQRVQWIARRRAQIGAESEAPRDSLLAHAMSEEREALLEMETAFDAVRAIWTGIEVRVSASTSPRSLQPNEPRHPDSWLWNWKDALQANWTMQSAALRHALRVTIVGGVDVVAMRLLNINHGFWLPMTSIILLQPYSAGTARKSMQRVSGTIAGGVLAAVLAGVMPDTHAGQEIGIAAITLLAALTVATFAVDYAVYSFFLTPTFVLMSLPHPHDWRYALVRIGTTLAGATIALAAMRLLWPERAEEELGRLLRRGAAADAEYLRALLKFWEMQERRRAEREVLAVSRRACGLASNDAEEALDRVMQEPQFGCLAAEELRLRNEALTFATYLRRLTQSVTTLAVVGRPTPLTGARLRRAAARMDAVAAGTGTAMRLEENPTAGLALVNVAEEQMQRVERQVGILEKAAAGLRGKADPLPAANG
jgi:uncharacterized membrane protein YccC